VTAMDAMHQSGSERMNQTIGANDPLLLSYYHGMRKCGKNSNFLRSRPGLLLCLPLIAVYCPIPVRWESVHPTMLVLADTITTTTLGR
jgi:hypothetical protein